jgi:hypothetical protein
MEDTKMKKLLIMNISMLFVFSLGTAYAESLNGVTDFSGSTYDSFVAIPAQSNGAMVEGSGAGGLRDWNEALSNGITDFSGSTYDSLVAIPAESNGAINEGAGAGGLRDATEGISNGVTDFSGRNYGDGAM